MLPQVLIVTEKMPSIPAKGQAYSSKSAKGAQKDRQRQQKQQNQ
jgi:hypothetical protein